MSGVRGAIARFGDCAIGVAEILIGVAMLCGILVLGNLTPKDAWHAVGVCLGLALYTIVAELFILLGLKQIAPNSDLIERLTSRSLLLMAAWLAGTAFVIVVVAALILWF